ncbi:MAG: hypothetical protein A3E79_09405 [Burkholderiales bacterium RIFCSPHIGHO2_12_FULL_61_11]|nr:MAG: hypothetical protein A3E79_09405 [Burkholderiales bacterium RIFCSPHIGHO2_12_FULL_61_11]
MNTLTLWLAGDVMTGRGIDQIQAHAVPPVLYENWVHDARDYVQLAERVNGPVPAPVTPDYIWGDALAETRSASPPCAWSIWRRTSGTGACPCSYGDCSSRTPPPEAACKHCLKTRAKNSAGGAGANR